MFVFASTRPGISSPGGSAIQKNSAAEAEANRRGSTVVIAVVDDGGHQLLLHRLDNTQVASVEVGIGKARTAAIFRRPSREFEEQIKSGGLRPGIAWSHTAA